MSKEQQLKENQETTDGLGEKLSKHKQAKKQDKFWGFACLVIAILLLVAIIVANLLGQGEWWSFGILFGGGLGFYISSVCAAGFWDSVNLISKKISALEKEMISEQQTPGSIQTPGENCCPDEILSSTGGPKTSPQDGKESIVVVEEGEQNRLLVQSM